VLVCAALGLVAAAGVTVVRMSGDDTGRARSTGTPLAAGAAGGARPVNSDNRIVLQNKLYKVGRIPASQCKEPTVRATSLAKVKLYYTQFLGCLNTAWAPVVREAGYQFTAPKLVAYLGHPASMGCDLTSSAVYCAGTIYMSADYDLKNQATNDPLWTRTTMAFLIAHEYGHHVQAMTGILEASHHREMLLRSPAMKLLESRRRELQASCLSGVYLGADKLFFPARGSWLLKWNWTVGKRGDEWNPKRTHGNKTNHSRWSRAGFTAADPAACNTFTAKPSAVS
jgi:hypothetical protein